MVVRLLAKAVVWTGVRGQQGDGVRWTAVMAGVGGDGVGWGEIVIFLRGWGWGLDFVDSVRLTVVCFKEEGERDFGDRA